MLNELFTIGHSQHSAEQFVDLLRQHQIGALVDIRRFPGSRKYPQFDQEEFAKNLPEHGIKYHWLQSLGGRRPKVKGFVSPNTGLRNESFRNYADYMLTDGFREGISTLEQITETQRTAIMCAESVFWRCHRRLVSDFWVANGGSVQHIFPSGEAKPHKLTDGVKLDDGCVTYPGQRMLFDFQADANP